jgi:hypothetical protein
MISNPASFMLVLLYSFSAQRMIAMASPFFLSVSLLTEAVPAGLRGDSAPKVRNWARLGCGGRRAGAARWLERCLDDGSDDNLALRPPRPSRAVGCVPEPACGRRRRG